MQTSEYYIYTVHVQCTCVKKSILENAPVGFELTTFVLLSFHSTPVLLLLLLLRSTFKYK
jgi:hypothetical protein